MVPKATGNGADAALHWSCQLALLVPLEEVLELVLEEFFVPVLFVPCVLEVPERLLKLLDFAEPVQAAPTA